MPVAYIDTPYCWVRLRGEHLVVTAPRSSDDGDETLQDIPLLGLERLVLREHTQVTTDALCALFAAGIPTFWTDYKGDCLGMAHAPSRAETETRFRQYERARDPVFVLSVTRRLVATKIRNQRRLLQRLDAARPRLGADASSLLASTELTALSAPDPVALRGVEGAAAASYFALWAQFLPAEFPFEKRSTRPPHNAVNATLSYAFTLLYHDLVAAIHLRGLDPGLGMLHATENGRWSLALDLMEPFRPAVAEALTVRLFSHRILQARHFEARDGGVFLTRDGRRELIQHYERRLDRPFLSEQAGHRTTLRQAYDDQVLSFKAALEDPASFKAFELN